MTEQEEKANYEVWTLYGRSACECEELYNMTRGDAIQEARRIWREKIRMPEFYCLQLKIQDGDEIGEYGDVLLEYNECPSDWRCADCGKDSAQVNFALDNHEYCVDCHGRRR